MPRPLQVTDLGDFTFSATLASDPIDFGRKRLVAVANPFAGTIGYWVEWRDNEERFANLDEAIRAYNEAK